jgi:putative chitinase
MQPIKELGGMAFFKRMYDIHGDRPAKARELGNLTREAAPGSPAEATFSSPARRIMPGHPKKSASISSPRLTLPCKTPDLAMQAGIASVIMYSRLKAGWFTWKKLSDYFKPGLSDAYNSPASPMASIRLPTLPSTTASSWSL